MKSKILATLALSTALLSTSAFATSSEQPYLPITIKNATIQTEVQVYYHGKATHYYAEVPEGEILKPLSHKLEIAQMDNIPGNSFQVSVWALGDVVKTNACDFNVKVNLDGTVLSIVTKVSGPYLCSANGTNLKILG